MQIHLSLVTLGGDGGLSFSLGAAVPPDSDIIRENRYIVGSQITHPGIPTLPYLPTYLPGSVNTY